MVTFSEAEGIAYAFLEAFTGQKSVQSAMSLFPANAIVEYFPTPSTADAYRPTVQQICSEADSQALFFVPRYSSVRILPLDTWVVITAHCTRENVTYCDTISLRVDGKKYSPVSLTRSVVKN